MKTTDEMIEVMQAYCEGKIIECKSKQSGHPWMITKEPDWNWYSCDYRVKPEPLEIFVALYENNNFGTQIFSSAKFCVLANPSCRKVIRFVEDTEYKYES